MTDSLKETRRQNKIMELAIDKTIYHNKALENFFYQNSIIKNEEFEVQRDIPQSPQQFKEYADYNDSKNMSDLSNGFSNMNDDKDIAPRIHKLISQYPEDEVDSRVIKFFEAFDQTQLQ